MRAVLPPRCVRSPALACPSTRHRWRLRPLYAAAADTSPDANTAAAPSTSAPAAAAAAAAVPVPVTATQASYSSREEEIAARIAASRLRRANRPPMLKCPACSIGVGTPQGLYQHLSACCPDLLQPASAAAEWKAALTLDRAAAAQAVAPLLQRAAEQEQRLRDQVIHLTFRSSPGPEPVRMPCSQVASLMQLPEARVSELLQRAMRAYPMPADPDPPEVVYEDDQLLGTNKPPGLNTAPAHRYVGGSMVNRVIGYLGRPPHVLHRLDMDTSGLLLFTKTQAAARDVSLQFRRRSVRKWYLALCIGVPQRSAFRVHTLIGRHPTETVARLNLPLPPGFVPGRLHERQVQTTVHASYERGEGSGSSSSGQQSGSLESSRDDGADSAVFRAGSSAAAAADWQGMGNGTEHEVTRGARGSRHRGKAVRGLVDDSDSASSSSDAEGLSEAEDSEGSEASGAGAREALTSCVVVAVNPDVDLSAVARPGSLFEPAHTANLRGACLIACSPHTGRTHQIRVHCQHMGHPLLGDELYGVQVPWIERQALHATALQVHHPDTQQPVLLSAPLPHDMQQALQALGLQPPTADELPAIWEGIDWERCDIH